MAESGVAIAIVVDNKDDSGTGRVRVRYPWHEQPRETFWARVATPMAGKSRGLYLIPEEGDEVLVAFDRGDLRLPYVIGSLWSSSQPAPAANTGGQNDVRLLRTRAGHTLTFDDGASGRVELRLNDGKRLAIDGERIQLQDASGAGITIHSGSGAMTIEAAGQLTLRAPQIAIEATGTVDVSAAGRVRVRGSLVQLN
jgi:uncharacterized protein involved in type VI secretion and phage assembly